MPYYEPVADEVTVFGAAYANGLPVLLKGPTGCGKTRFMGLVPEQSIATGTTEGDAGLSAAHVRGSQLSLGG